MSLLSTTRKNLLTITMAISNYRFNHVCWVKSWFYNALWFGLRDSFRMPIYIYNDVHIMATGQVRIIGEMKKGMIKIGVWKAKANSVTRIFNNTTIIFNGETEIRGGAVIENEGIIEFGEYVRIGESCHIMCQEKITFGHHIATGFNTTIMDTDFHFVLNIKEMTTNKCTRPIVIGSGSWISSDCKVMKGSILPNNSILCGNSLLNKDFSSEPSNTVFMGVPAKPTKSGYRRIYNTKEQDLMLDFFRTHTERNKCDIEVENLDEYCFSSF